MRKLITSTWVSLDGYVAGPDGDMSWVPSSYDVDKAHYNDETITEADTLLLGRVTYDSFAGSWPQVPDEPDIPERERAYARRLNTMRKIVFSKTPDKLEWNNSELRTDLVAEDIQKLKAEPGKNILVYGSASIVQQLTNLGLVDQYQLLVHPIILGGGKALFANLDRPVKLQLMQAKPRAASGVVALYYQPQTAE